MFLLKVSLWWKWGAEEQGGGLLSSPGCDAQKHFWCGAGAPGCLHVPSATTEGFSSPLAGRDFPSEILGCLGLAVELLLYLAWWRSLSV